MCKGKAHREEEAGEMALGKLDRGDGKERKDERLEKVLR